MMDVKCAPQRRNTGRNGLLAARDRAPAAAAWLKKAAAEAPYETADRSPDSQIVSLQASGADIFFDVSTPKFAAQAIKKVAEIG